ncbi:MAG: transglutaminase [Leptospiraceae bacterium]|nr:transglutaminase family protein [Leptospiraceae bacterium]MCP5493709.1 transglutaminase [Leptospiraceae bacterium]
MLSEEHSETISFSFIELEELFYQLENSNPNEKHSIIQTIGSRIPWYCSIPEIIDQFSNPSFRILGRSFLRDLTTYRVEHHLSMLSQKGNRNHYNDLEQGVYLLSTMDEDNTTTYSEFKLELERIAYRIEELFETNKVILTDTVKIHLLARVLSQEEGFMGNKMSYYDPGNSFITRVLKTKLGIPISLSVVYLLIAKRLNLPIYGANFPFHFMCYYEREDYSVFVDPYHGGILIEKEVCAKFLRINGFKESPDDFVKSSTITILKRMYKNLINVYLQAKQSDKASLFAKQLQILENSSPKSH